MNEVKTPCPVLLLGMGNILLEDEGLGIRALEALEGRFDIPPEIECLDGGTTGMGLLDSISGREHLIVLDAVQTGDPPGTFVALRGENVPVYFGLKITPHQLGLADVLATLELTEDSPGTVTVLGLVPESLELELELSPLIRGRLDQLVEAAVRELEVLGYPLQPLE